MTLDEAHKLALKILKQVMEENVNENNVQLAQVSSLRHSEMASRSRQLCKLGQSHRKRQGSAIPNSFGRRAQAFDIRDAVDHFASSIVARDATAISSFLELSHYGYFDGRWS